MGIQLTHVNAQFGNLLLILLFFNFTTLVELKKLDRFSVQNGKNTLRNDEEQETTSPMQRNGGISCIP